MEFADDGDLYHKISEQKKKKKYFEEAYIWTTVVHMIRGLKELHDRKILHRDLKVRVEGFRPRMCFLIEMDGRSWGI